MSGSHSDKSMEGAAFRRGEEGDARRGTVYGHRTAAEYNKVKIAATEKDEGRKVVLMHFARKLSNDNRILEFVVVNGHLDPGMKVYSRVPEAPFIPQTIAGDPAKGTVTLVGQVLMEEWPRTEEDGRYVFHAPDSYQGGPITWLHDKDLGDESLVYEQTKKFFEINNPATPLEDVGLAERSKDDPFNL